MRVYSYIILFLFSATISFAQDGSEKLSSKEHINRIKRSGVFLVQLHDEEARIKALKDRGYLETAERIKAEQVEKNAKILEAFKNHFTYCEVYYFYSSNSKQVKSGDYEIPFYKDDLSRTSLVNLKNSFVYILDPEKVFLQGIDNGSLYKGMSIMNADYSTMPSPFPYYVRKHDGIFFLRRTELEMVVRLQERLEKFEKRANKN